MASYNVGITGGIGSGKSLFSSVCRDRGYMVLDADTLAKELMQTSTTIKDSLIQEFGTETYSDGILNKVFLAETIFNNPLLLKKVNDIVHPVVIREISEALNNTPGKIAFAESALIFESNFTRVFDIVVVVAADDNLRIERAIGRGGVTREQVLKIVANQIPQSEKIAKANHVLYNNQGVQEFIESVNKFLDSLEQLP